MVFNEANKTPEDNDNPVTDRQVELRVQHELNTRVSSPEDEVTSEYLHNQGGVFLGEDEIDTDDIGRQGEVLNRRQERLDNLSVVGGETIDLSRANDAQRELVRNNIIQSMTVLNPNSSGQMSTVVRALLNNRAQ